MAKLIPLISSYIMDEPKKMIHVAALVKGGAILSIGINEPGLRDPDSDYSHAECRAIQKYISIKGAREESCAQ